MSEIDDFKNGNRKNIKYQTGDIFSFKISRTEFGFGRILLDVNSLRKKKLIPSGHGLNYLMGPPILVEIFAYTSPVIKVDVDNLIMSPVLPSDYMMDSVIYYGDYEIIGHREVEESQFHFPLSYGRVLDHSLKNVFFQWGLIHKELPLAKFDKYLFGENLLLPNDSPSRQVKNPYGYYSIGFSHHYKGHDIKRTIANNGNFEFNESVYYGRQFDLRNPKNSKVKDEIMHAFGLNPKASYEDNRALTNTIKTKELIDKLKG